MLSVRIKKQLGNGSAAAGDKEIQVRPLSEPRTFALDVDFVAPAGVTILFGPSGAGKTTVLSCVAGIVSPDAGSIKIGDSVLFDSEREIDIPIRKRGVGYVFQDLALFPHL